MGLKVAFHLMYRRKRNRGLLFWKDGTVKVVTHTDRNDLIEEVKIEAGTIVINDDGEDISKSRLAVYHECFHDEFHWLFFRRATIETISCSSPSTEIIFSGESLE